MQIGFDAKRAFHNSSGLGNYSRDLIRLLSERWSSDEFFLFNPKESNRVFEYNRNNTQVVSPVKGFYKKSGAIWRQFRISGIAKQLKIDVFHGLSNELPQNVKKHGLKSIVTIHDLIFERYPEWYNSIDRQMYRRKTKHAAKVADKVVTISNQTKQDLIDFYQIPSEKIEVVYQGCHPSFQKKFSKESFDKVKLKFDLPDQFLLYVGTVEPRKNLMTVLKAIKDQPHIPLVVVGRLSDYGKKAFQWVADHNMSHRVFHLSGITMHELAMVYQLARLFTYPSTFEGFGIPIIEALFSRTPVITGRGGCFPEAGGPNSLYIQHDDIESWQREIVALWGDEKRMKAMADEGFSYAKRFKDDEILKSWEKVYQAFR